MAKKNSMKRSLIFSVTSVMLSASMFVGTTFAWFTDSVTSKNNIIKSGNLDVELYYQTDTQTEWTKVSSSTTVFKNTLWEPGHTEVVKLKVANEGSLDLKYQLGVNIVDEVDSVNVEGKPFKLSDFIQYGIVEGANNYDTREKAIDAVTSVATDLNVAYNSGTTALSSGKDDFVTMVVYMPEEVGNEANHAKGENVPTIKLGLNLVATQLASEEDSFGPDYDKDAWADGFEVGTADDLQAALNNGVTNFVLKNDIVATESIVIPASEVSMMSARATNATVIDLNGNKIVGTVGRDENNNRVHTLKNEGTLVIKNGTISSTGANGGSVIYNAGTLTVEDVTLNGAPKEGDSYPSYVVNNYGDFTITNCDITANHGAIYVGSGAKAVVTNVNVVKNYQKISSHIFYNSGELTVNSGSFEHNGFDGSIIYNCGNATFNGGTYTTSAGGYGPALLSGVLTINGGTFNCGILAWGGSAVITGGTFSSQPKAEFLAEGYTAVKTDNVWTVTFPQESVDSFIENATAGDTVQLPAGTYSFPASKLEAGVTVECAEGVVFSGTSSLNINGATVIGGTFTNVGGTTVSGTVNGNFVDCTFNGYETLRWCYTSEGTTTVFENCVINTNFRGVHFDEMNGDVIFKNCEINGFNAYSGSGTMTFENCTFGNDKSNYNGLNIYTNTNLINCTFNFNSGKTNFIDMEEVGKTLTITDCKATLDGKAAAVQSFVGGSKLADCTVVFDGLTLTAVSGYSHLYTDAESNFYVYDAEGLQSMKNWMDAKANSGFWGKTYNVMADIDASTVTWNTKALSPDSSYANGITFNGNNHTISNLTINGQGLFTGATNGTKSTIDPTFKNITFDNATVTGKNHHNGLIWGEAVGGVTLNNVTVVNSKISGGCNVGGLIGRNSEQPVTFTFIDCAVKNTTIEATRVADYAGASAFLGMALKIASSCTATVVFEGNNVSENNTITSVNGTQGGGIYTVAEWGCDLWEKPVVVSTFENFSNVNGSNGVYEVDGVQNVYGADGFVALGGQKLGGKYALKADLDLTGYDVKPIAAWYKSLVVNGNNHKISNVALVIDDTHNSLSSAGLFFVSTDSSLTVNDLTVENVTVSDKNGVGAKYASNGLGAHVAAIVGYADGNSTVSLNNVDVANANIVDEYGNAAILVGYTVSKVNLTNCDIAANCTAAGELDNGAVRADKTGAFVATANTASCVVTLTDCTNASSLTNYGRVINGATWND